MIAHRGGNQSSVPRGLEAVYDFNGVTLNDRRYADVYRLTSIDGLNDADIRDAREVNPATHGETAFESFYSGRTITLEGVIEAGNLSKLREMTEDLRTALLGLTEETLKIRFWDYSEEFNDSDATDRYTSYSGLSTLSLSSGSLVPTDNTEKRFYRSFEGKSYADAAHILHFTTGSSVTGSFTGIELKVLDDNNRIRLSWDADGADLDIIKVDGGTPTELNTAAASVSVNTSYKMVLKIIGNVVTGYVYDGDDDPNSEFSTPTATVTTTLAGADATKFGSGIYGYSGLRLVPSTASPTAWSYHADETIGISPGDVTIEARKSQPLVVKEEQTSRRMTRNFLITLRASKPQFLSTFVTNETVVNDPTIGQTIDSMDDFSQTAGALNNKALDIGSTWQTSWAGSDADDFNVDGAGVVTRTAVSDADFYTGRYAVHDNAQFANTIVQVDFKTNVFVDAQGVIARFVDSDNWLIAAATAPLFGFLVVKSVAGTPTVLASGDTSIFSRSINTYYTIRLDVNDEGDWSVWGFTTGSSKGEPLASGNDSALATGGALDTGYPGFYDVQTDSDAATRTYDNYVAVEPISLVTLTNRGNFDSEPTFRITGPFTDPEVLNDTTGEFLRIIGTIATSDYLDINIKEKTIVDQDGASMFSMFDTNSNWLTLAPGDNDISLMFKSSTNGSSSSLKIAYRDTWM